MYIYIYIYIYNIHIYIYICIFVHMSMYVRIKSLAKRPPIAVSRTENPTSPMARFSLLLPANKCGHTEALEGKTDGVVALAHPQCSLPAGPERASSR